MKNFTFNYLISLGLSLILTISTLYTQAQTFEFSDSWAEEGFSLKSENRSGVNVVYSISSFTMADITTAEGETAKNILLPHHFLPNDEGAPNLPGSGRYIAIPNGAKPVLNIVSSRTEKYTGIDVAPAPRIPLDTDNEPLKFIKDNNLYEKNAFYPANPIALSEVSTIRGVEVVILGVTPFQYNPVTKELIVYRDVEVEVQFEGGTGTYGDPRLRSRFWDPILNDALMNYESLPEINYAEKIVNNRSDEGSEYVIIVPDGPEFMDWAEVIQEHRIKQGITTEIVTLTEIGGNSAPQIEAYIDNAYNNWDPAPSAILLMADYGSNMNNSITSPLWDNYCVSDNIYADVDNDDMPDIILARMTANNETELETYVTKFINYEMDPPMSFDFYNHPITALGYQTERWFQICSESVAGFFEVVYGKNPVRINAIYSGNPQTGPWSTNQNTQMVLDVFGPNGLGYIPATPGMVNCSWNGTGADVTNAINDGAFLLQHRDHGSVTGWGEPDYQNSDINNLTNTELTFVFSINCLTGKYNSSQECFTEKFHRHTNNGVNAGALGLIAASEVSYSFVNDTYVWGMYDNMWPEFMPMYGPMGDIEERGMLPAYGNAAGKYFLQQSNWPYNTNNKEVTYHLFHHHGDAFLELYSEVPETNDIIHDGIILAGLDQFTITAEEGSVICLTANGEIIGLGEGTGAPEVIYITPQTVGTIVTLTVTKSNYLRHEEEMEVIPADGPYCIYDSHEVNDPEGNGNGLVDFDEIIDLTLEVKNVGLDDGEDVEITITTASPYILFYDDNENYGTIPSAGSVTVENGFQFYVTDAVPDQEKIFFTLNATDGTESWESIFVITANAPELHINELVMDDSEYGDGDGILDPGEHVEMSINYSNSGHAVAYDVNSYLEAQSGFVEVLNPNQTFASIGYFGNFTKTFDVVVDDDAPEGIVVKYNNELTMNNYLLSKIWPIKVTPKCEDFETGDFSKFSWQHDGEDYWSTSNQYPYAGLFSAMSGEISDNQSSELSINYKVMTADSIVFIRKVSSEPGDKLQFYIGNTLKDEWSGTTTGWHRESYPVGAGNKTFRWVYVKNGSGSGGADCAWLDDIILPPPESLTIWAGPNDKVCVGESYILEDAFGTMFIDAEWTTSGTGTFVNNTIINTSYEPSDDDISNGEVILTLTLTDDQGNVVADEMALSFKDVPQSPPTPEGPDYVDLLTTVTSDYSTEGLEGINEYVWSIEPEEAGTIESMGPSGTVTWNPDYLGTATIYAAAINECGEGEYSEGFEVAVDNTVGVEEPASDEFFVSVAPNPSNGIFYLSVRDKDPGQLKVKVVSLVGNELYREAIEFNQQLNKSIDLTSIPDGIYFIVIEKDNKITSRKIIKK